jgi:DNA-binding MarR family transcriptional regulator/NAD(P)-dependent dehydrogenase (short-subunit alcohol dehydrogenase family)
MSAHKLRFKPGHLIWRAYQLTWQLFADEAGPLDITPVQEALLLALAERANVDQKTLAELVALDRSTAGNVIERLQRRGFITRVQNVRDRRARLVSLTPHGRALSQKLGPIAQRAARRLLAPLSPVERTEFTRLLRKVTGLADPSDYSATLSASGRLEGKKILCIGLSDTFGQTIVDHLRSDGADVTELAVPAAEAIDGADFASHLKAVLTDRNGTGIVINGGNLPPPSAAVAQTRIFSEVQAIANMRWFMVERLMPHLLARDHARIINLALFPTTEATADQEIAAIAANASIVLLSAQIAEEYRDRGIVSNCISPRFRSNAHHAALGNKQPRISYVPAIDVGLAASYLVSDEARSVSASNLVLG